jgi:integrase
LTLANKCAYGTHTDRRRIAVPSACQKPNDMKAMLKKTMLKITESVRSARLSPVEGALVPSVTFDTDVPGFALHVTTRRAFWAVTYQPRGINPATGKRWGGGVRLDLGDAYAAPLADARAAARAVKANVSMGRDPHRERMAARTAAVAERAILTQSTGDALDAYLKTIESNDKLASNTKRLKAHYVRKAVRVLEVESETLSAVDDRAIARMLDQVGSRAEKWHLFEALRLFLDWAKHKNRRLVEHNPCDDFEKRDRPDRPRNRDNVPPLALLQAVWNALEHEPPYARDMGRFLLLMPLRRSEAATLRRSDVDLAGKRISIPGDKMKNGERHELPLSPAAFAILEARSPVGGLVFGTTEGKLYKDWGGVIARLRKAIGQGEATKETRFTWHDVRRAFVSHLAGKFDVDLLDQCLSHTRKGVFGVYQRSSRWPERVAALNAWAELICGEALPEVDNVLRFIAR